MRYSITRLHKFDAGHRVLGHEGKCRHPHGHEYHLQFTCTPVCNDLDDLGMVIDFSVIKDVVCSWVDEYLDHGFLVYKQDSELLEALRKLEDSKIYVMDKNPTAENIAKLLLDKANQLLTHYPVLCEQVTVQETVNCFATADIFRDEE